MVITRRTRNPLAFRGPWVRIPPAPPSKKLFAFFGKELFAWKDLPSGVFPAYAPSPHLFCSYRRYPPAGAPYPQPVNKAAGALPEIRRTVHHSRALPSYPSQMYINPCPSGTLPKEFGSIYRKDTKRLPLSIPIPGIDRGNLFVFYTSCNELRKSAKLSETGITSPSCVQRTILLSFSQ